ncbi:MULTISPECIES: variant leucine-rich repeat-containing protein [unclassified Actinomyces]|uniref:variant leucine-rich repeat-containing protein n=1 Tax=unclassified Actinomyces TaxID=2609248 RepID=UPI001357BB28|nr:MULTISPECIES: hypothetical protein [unclassified Actinomyces]
MTAIDPLSCTPAHLTNPAIAPGTLAQIAQHRPDLRAHVRQHPACPPDLAAWIDQQAYQQPHYQSAPAQYGTAQPQASAALGGAAITRASSNWSTIVLIAIPVIGLLAIIASFLPAVSTTFGSQSKTANFWDYDNKSYDVQILCASLLAISAGICAFFVRQFPVVLGGGVATVVGGIWNGISWLNANSEISDAQKTIKQAKTSYGSLGGSFEVSRGVGMYLLLIAALLLLACGAAMIVAGLRLRPGAGIAKGASGYGGHPGAHMPTGPQTEPGAQPSPYQQQGPTYQ